MFCHNCGKKLEKDTKFCDQCGQRVEISEKEKIPPHEETSPIKPNEKMKQISNHLEFLGYVCEISESNGKQYILASHETKYNIFFNEPINEIVYLQISIKINKGHLPEIENFINKINAKLNVCRLYFIIENDANILRIESFYMGDYVKKLFGDFFDLMENDQRIIYADPDFNRIFVAN